MEYRTGLIENADLIRLFEDPARLVCMKAGKDPDVDYADDGKEISAFYFGSRRHLDDTYLLYAYHYKDREYGFLWETYFDEAQRASAGGEPHVWYDDVREGDAFPVRIRLKDPRQHVVLSGPFTGINDSMVLFISNSGHSLKERINP